MGAHVSAQVSEGTQPSPAPDTVTVSLLIETLFCILATILQGCV